MNERSNGSPLNNLETFLVRGLTSILFTGIFILAGNPECTESLKSLKISDIHYLVAFFCIFVLLTLLDYVFCKNNIVYFDLLMLLAVSAVYGMICMLRTYNVYSAGMTAVLVIGAAKYTLGKLPAGGWEQYLPKKRMYCILGFFTGATFLYLGSLLILRVVMLKSVTYDFGIFVQMFYYLKKCLIPYTTCERDILLSHFTVHFSPFFYLLLPIYALFPTPATLIVIQLAAVVSGVIPLFLMCRRKKTSNYVTIAICLAYLLYPTFRGGLFFDFHENKFLPPLILWLLYFFDMEKWSKKKYIGVTVFTLLILAVKEDAPIYAACIGLYYAVGAKEKRQKAAGAVVFLFSVAYFFTVFHFMSVFTDSGSAITSFGRYENLTADGYTGIKDIVMNMMKDPAYVVNQLMSAEKLEFIIWMFLPLLFLPFRSKKAASYILLIPLVVLNLLSDYEYQHSIYYQYAYASGVLVIYLAFLEMQTMKGKRAAIVSVCVCLSSLLLSTACISDRNSYYSEYQQQKESLEETKELLSKIPKDASVSAYTIFVPYLAERDEIYRHSEGDEADYIVLTLRSRYDETMEEVEQYQENGYEIFGMVEKRVIILKKTS